MSQHEQGNCACEPLASAHADGAVAFCKRSARIEQNMYASAPKSTVGTVAYIAPEVLTCKRDHTKYKVSTPCRSSLGTACCTGCHGPCHGSNGFDAPCSYHFMHA